MNPAAASLIERARSEQHEPQEQPDAGLFDHCLAKMPLLMRRGQVEEVTGWSRSTIYLLCETSERPGGPTFLETHEIPGRDRSDKRITRRSVAAFLLRTANYHPADFSSLLRLTLPTMTAKMLHEMRRFIDAEFSRRGGV